MSPKDAIKIGATVIAAFVPPAISPDVLRWVRMTFNTVGIQDPLTEYGGDISFFLVISSFLLLPWILAFAFRFAGMPCWTSIFPWTALIAVWFIYKATNETAGYLFWIAYLGYFGAGLGFAARDSSANRWQQIVWIPPLIFLAAYVMWPSWWDVFFE